MTKDLLSLLTFFGFDGLNVFTCYSSPMMHPQHNVVLSGSLYLWIFQQQWQSIVPNGEAPPPAIWKWGWWCRTDWGISFAMRSNGADPSFHLLTPKIEQQRQFEGEVCPSLIFKCSQLPRPLRKPRQKWQTPLLPSSISCSVVAGDWAFCSLRGVSLKRNPGFLRKRRYQQLLHAIQLGGKC